MNDALKGIYLSLKTTHFMMRLMLHCSEAEDFKIGKYMLAFRLFRE